MWATSGKDTALAFYCEPKVVQRGGPERWPKEAAQRGGPKRRPREAAQRGGPERWPREVAQRGGPERWPREVAQKGGPESWPREAAQRGGRKRWPREVAEKGGPERWPKEAGQRGGPERWPEKVAQRGGPERWPKEAAQRGGRKRWPREVAEKGGPERWPSEVAQRGGPKWRPIEVAKRGGPKRWPREVAQRGDPKRQPREVAEKGGPERWPKETAQRDGPERWPREVAQRGGPKRRPREVAQRGGPKRWPRDVAQRGGPERRPKEVAQRERNQRQLGTPYGKPFSRTHNVYFWEDSAVGTKTILYYFDQDSGGATMLLRDPVWRLLLLALLLCPWTLCNACPKNCTCNMPEFTIFCIQRRSPSMPLKLPPSIQNLYVFQNGITSLQHQDFVSLAELRMLDLSQNQLKEIPDGVFRSLTSLHNLDLSSNYITHLSKDSFAGLENLERLYVHSNHIQSIHPAAFKNLEHLLELKLQGNKINILPSLHLPRLLLLDLSYNSIPAPGPADLQTPHLESLKMAGLGLTTLDEGLMRSLGNLHDLDVSYNQLAEMPPALRSAKGLIRLNLAFNPLGLLRQEDFQNLVGLQELDLSSLNIQGFPAGFFQMFPRLHHLTAAENPFNCLCPLAWFSSWLKESKVDLGRTEETRCHFPPLNAGKMLAELEHKDFGCPTTTTELSVILTSSSTDSPPEPTTASWTTHAFPPVSPSEEPSIETNSRLSPEETASPSSYDRPEDHMCPSNICLNGGTCRFDQQGHLDCLCPPGISGTYCENWDESQPPPIPPREDVIATVPAVDKISSHHVTSTSITLDLHRYIEARPHIRGIRITYRNLSGPDRRPLQLSVPPTYPEYTLRGLQPNCTYSVCASPLGEPAEYAKSSCMEARTAGVLFSSHQPSINKNEPSPTLVPILVAVAVVMAVAIIAAVVVVSRRRRAKSPADMDLGEPAPFELEGVKACLENGSAPQKHPEIMPCPPVSQNGMEYEIPLIQEQFPANNNTDGRIPSYIRMQKCAALTSGP
ncbi:hypothetical protein NFI96_003882 [Prochilodus magdalenae]|nr:hypothetical protein NFI96_003882 [Prochilodus magdalenae]